jgi:pimeloyl-ACP methyl ester carboxylesterase
MPFSSDYKTDTIRLAGGRYLTYRHIGDEEQPTVLLLHGMGGSHEDMLALAESLRRQHSCQLLLPDLPGHGDSADISARPTVIGLADEIAEFLQAMNKTEVLTVGHSFGAAIATALAAYHPALVSRLVLLDPGMVLPEQTKDSLGELYDSLTPDGFARTVHEVFGPMLFGPDDPSSFAAAFLHSMVSTGVETFRSLGYAVVGFDGTDAVANVGVPTLLIGTANPFANLDEVRAANPRWAIKQQSDSSHCGLVLHPAVHRDTREFFFGQYGDGSRVS